MMKNSGKMGDDDIRDALFSVKGFWCGYGKFIVDGTY